MKFDIISTAPFVKLMLKVLGITIIAEISSSMCRDYGNSSLASSIEFGAKVVVITLIFPLFKTIISIVNGLVKWKDLL